MNCWICRAKATRLPLLTQARARSASPGGADRCPSLGHHRPVPGHTRAPPRSAAPPGRTPVDLLINLPGIVSLTALQGSKRSTGHAGCLESGERTPLAWPLLSRRATDLGAISPWGADPARRAFVTHGFDAWGSTRVRTRSPQECVGETLRAALDDLASLVPDWLVEHMRADGFDRSSHRVEHDHLPTSTQPGTSEPDRCCARWHSPASF